MGCPGSQKETIDRIKIDCQWCVTTLKRLPSELESLERGPFCDLDCYGEWLSDNVVREDHHQWEGGALNYGSGWWKVRRAALDRDDYRCQQCGSDRQAIGRNPDVHHIKPVREFSDPEDAHKLDNVVSLCRSCHRLVESNQLTPPAPDAER